MLEIFVVDNLKILNLSVVKERFGNSSMEVTILFFASAKDRAGQSRMTMEIEPDTTVVLLKQKLEQLYPSIQFERDGIKLAVNQVYCDDDGCVLKNGDTIALIPPVSGG